MAVRRWGNNSTNRAAAAANNNADPPSTAPSASAGAAAPRQAWAERPEAAPPSPSGASSSAAPPPWVAARIRREGPQAANGFGRLGKARDFVLTEPLIMRKAEQKDFVPYVELEKARWASLTPAERRQKEEEQERAKEKERARAREAEREKERQEGKEKPIDQDEASGRKRNGEWVWEGEEDEEVEGEETESEIASMYGYASDGDWLGIGEGHPPDKTVRPYLWTVGCGAIHTDLLVETLYNEGVESVLDVRLLDHSSKRPWLNREVLEKKFEEYGLTYKWVGKEPATLKEWARLVKKEVLRACPEMWDKRRVDEDGNPGVSVCLLSLREDPQEDGMMALGGELSRTADWHVIHFRHPEVMSKGFHFLPEFNGAVYPEWAKARAYLEGFQSQVTALRPAWWNRNVNPTSWQDWRITKKWPKRGERPILIHLPWDTYVYFDPCFLNEDKIRSLHQKISPGALDFDQPRRRVRNQDGSWTEFTEHAKEAWLCNDYDLPDNRRVCEPYKFKGQRLPLWAVEMFMKARNDLGAHFNSILCSWEPAGPHPKDGPHSFATHTGWTTQMPTLGLVAVGGTRTFHLHGIPYYQPDPFPDADDVGETVSIDIPLPEGALVLIGGPLQDKWLYGQPRDETWQDERTLMMLQLSTHPLYHKTLSPDELYKTPSGSDSLVRLTKEDILSRILGCTDKEMAQFYASEANESKKANSMRWKRHSV